MSEINYRRGPLRGIMVTLRFSPSPTLCVITLSYSRNARWIILRSRAGIGSIIIICPVSITRSAMRRANP